MTTPAREDVVAVPVEPTEAMLAAGERAWMNRNLSDPASAPIRDCYRAMLAAAPAQPAPEVVGLLQRANRALAEAVVYATMNGGKPVPEERSNEWALVVADGAAALRTASPSAPPVVAYEETFDPRTGEPLYSPSAPPAPDAGKVVEAVHPLDGWWLASVLLPTDEIRQMACRDRDKAVRWIEAVDADYARIVWLPSISDPLAEYDHTPQPGAQGGREP